MDNKNIKKSDSSKILADKFLQIPWYDWRKVLTNEKWARLAITGISGNRKQEQKVPQKAVIAIGAGTNYTLYDVGTDNTQFVKAGYKTEKRIKGFGRL